MVMVAMRRIGLERRIGDKEKTEMLFQEYIDKAGMKNVRGFYVIKYARYLYKVGIVREVLMPNSVNAFIHPYPNLVHLSAFSPGPGCSKHR